MVEAAILATRTAFLPLAEILAEFGKLAVLVERPAAPSRTRPSASCTSMSCKAARAHGLDLAHGTPMTPLRIRTPSRLHFGLLGWGPRRARQFGGVGLMIEAPGLELTAEPAPDWSFAGPLADRVGSSSVGHRTASS